MEWSEEESAVCLWLVEHLEEKSNGDNLGAFEALPLNEKIKLIKGYIGYGKRASAAKSKLTEEEIEKILFGYKDKFRMDIPGLRNNHEKVVFLQAILCWIGGPDYITNFTGMRFEKRLSKLQPISEIESVEVIYHLTQKESEGSDSSGWLTYKNKCASDYKYKPNWSVDYVTSPSSADEAIGALAFLKDIEDTDTIQLLIDICKEQFSDEPLVKRYLPKYEKFLVDYAKKQKDWEAYSEQYEKESEADDKKKMKQFLYMFLICVVAIIAIGIEVWLLQWWAILAGILTAGVPFVYLIFYENNSN